MMAKVQLKTTVEEVLDPSTLKKVKEHNRGICQQKKQDAIALRQRLEKWREEKKRMKSEEPKKARFVTTVLKVKPSQQAVIKPGPGNKPSKVPGPSAKPTGRLDQASKPVKKGPVNRSSFVRPSTSKQPAVVGKENRRAGVTQTQGLKQPAKLKQPAPSRPTSRTSLVKTPLSRNSGVGKRYTIASLTQREGREGNKAKQPMSLAEELKAALATSGTEEHDSNKETLQSSQTEFRATPASSSTVLNRSTSRNSLSSQFRKSKTGTLHSAPRGGQSSQSISSATKKAGSQSKKRSMAIAAISARNLRKSILKHNSNFVSSASNTAKALPPLPASSSSHLRKRKAGEGDSVNLNNTAKYRKDDAERQAKGTSEAAHVNFVTDVGRSGGEKAMFRKTPGKAKREKLNEWLALKGRTPTSLRHASCFHTERPIQRPRMLVKASMSVKQLSRQETALAMEETQMAATSPTMLSSTFACTTTTTTTSQPLRHSMPVMFTEHGDMAQDAHHRDHTEEDERADLGEESKALSPSEREGLNIHSASILQLEKDYCKCLEALQSGALSAHDAVQWLDKVAEACSAAQEHVGWYRCRVAALKMSADHDPLLATFEQAIVKKAQPAEEVAQLLTDTMRELLSTQTHTQCADNPRASATETNSCHSDVHQPDVCAENVFESTTVKYCVMEVTPFNKTRRTRQSAGKVPVVTPVRRSTRRSTSRPTAPPSQGRPVPGTPYMAEYSVLTEMPSAEKERMLFQPNQALEPLLRDMSFEMEEPAE